MKGFPLIKIKPKMLHIHENSTLASNKILYTQKPEHKKIKFYPFLLEIQKSVEVIF